MILTCVYGDELSHVNIVFQIQNLYLSRSGKNLFNWQML